VTEEQILKPFSTEGRAKLVKRLYDQRIPWHCALTCDFPVLYLGSDHGQAAKIISAVTGWDLNNDDMQTLCERVASLIRVFNIREGARRQNDTLAPRSFQPDLSGSGVGKVLTQEMLSEMLSEYYNLRGWDKDGVPTQEMLVKLGMSDVADELAKYGQSSRDNNQ
jgi:aldehyde:ferredoxin oxidoreductase